MWLLVISHHQPGVAHDALKLTSWNTREDPEKSLFMFRNHRLLWSVQEPHIRKQDNKKAKRQNKSKFEINDNKMLNR